MGDLAVAAVAFGISLAAAVPVLWILRRVQAFDIPTARSSHRSATPRSGGFAPAAGCVVAAILSRHLAGAGGRAVLFISASMGLIGLADDLHPLGVRPRLLGQAAVALGAVAWLANGLDGEAWVGVLAVGAILVWLVGFVNVFNFMDGINGLSVAQVVVAGVTWTLVGWHEHAPVLVAAGLIPVGAVIAFAPFNVPRARMFLGDVGSYFLGGWLAASAVVGLGAGVPPEAVIAPLAIYVADTSVTLARRVWRQQDWSQPHKEHAYQRLVQAGWSHGRTTLAVGLIMAAASALGTLSLTGSWGLRILGDTAALAAVAAYLMLPSWLPGDVTGSGAAVIP